MLEVLDARDPLGSRCREVEQAVMCQSDKRLVLVLNKADLVPRENLQADINKAGNLGTWFPGTFGARRHFFRKEHKISSLEQASRTARHF